MALPNVKNVARWGETEEQNTGLIASWGYLEWDGSEVTHYTDVVERTQNLLIEQFEDKPNINKLVAIFAENFQELEEVIDSLKSVRDLNTATADRLDILGDIVGVSRGTMDDDDYREAIRLQIFVNQSCGEPETIIRALRAFARTTAIHYKEVHPGKILLEFRSIFTPPARLREMLQRVALAGVKIMLSWSNDSDMDFGFDGEGGYPPDTNTLGFGETGYPLEGGRLIEKI